MTDEALNHREPRRDGGLLLRAVILIAAFAAVIRLIPLQFLHPLNWDEIDEGDHGRLRRIYRELIALRHNEPDLADPWLDNLGVDYDEDRRWIVLRRGSLSIACNLGAEAVDVPVTGEMVLAWGEPQAGQESTRLDGHSFAVIRAQSR